MHGEVVRRMHQGNLFQHDIRRQLPLKNAGLTDLFVKMRNARSDPKTLAFLVELYARPLRWLGVDRFIEVPDGVSCIAGPLSLATGIPYITIRAEADAKEGRVANARIIGEFKPGERVAILDDVVSDGLSKKGPYQICQHNGLDVVGFLVHTDRQHGWQEEFKKYGIKSPLWAGMTLHDIRRELISQALIDRCNPDIEATNPIIVALDGKSLAETMSIADRLRQTGCILKVNDLLVAEGVDRLLPELMVYGRVMVDLKHHDIPNTVKNACMRIRPYNPWAVTVQASGGPEMVAAARDTLNPSTLVLAVTVLTSFDPKTCDLVYHRKPIQQVKALAKLAIDAGAHGIVCSPEEVAPLRKAFPRIELVVPGVRSPGADRGDQRRVDTPARTIAAGATKLVMGRQILNAKDLVAEVYRVRNEELHM